MRIFNVKRKDRMRQTEEEREMGITDRKIRMVGMDLDGTLFTNDKKITEHTRKILKKTIEQGVVALAATGRPESGLPRELLEVPGISYALTSNGARIIRLPSRQVVYQQLILWDVALQAIHMMQTWEHCVWEVYFDGKVYVEDGEYHFLYHEDMSPALIEYIHKSRIFQKDLLGKIEREHIGLEKIHMVFEETSWRDEKLKELQEAFPQLDVSCATTFNMEINSALAGKGNGLLALGEILGISREEIMACGDAENDWDMLKKAGFSVVMENGNEATRKLADFVTRSNEEEGVAWALEQFVLTPQYEIRKAKENDLPAIMEIIHQAQRTMKQDGFQQWTEGYPGEEILSKDIEKQSCYLLTDQEEIVAVGTLYMENDPNYRIIEEGNWKTEEPYGTVHRLAVTEGRRQQGLAGILYDHLEKICREKGMRGMRVDTHRDNKKMQSWIRKQGFRPCGVIHVEDGTKRDAFEKPLMGRGDMDGREKEKR